MVREDISNLLNECTAKEVVLELSTGYGKTRYALEYINKYSPENILVGRDGKLRIATVNFWNNRVDVSADDLESGFGSVEQYMQDKFAVTVSSPVVKSL